VLAHPLGDGVELRELQPWQADVFTAHIERNRAHLTQWLPWVDSITDVESGEAWLQRYADKQATDSGRIFGIWAGPELLGSVLFRIFDTEQGSCEIGCWLGADAQGRGLMTTASQLLIDWAFGVRGMTRVEWHTTTENMRSIAVAKRLGMSQEGIMRQSFYYGGARYDTVVLAILAEEWRSNAEQTRR
jgi:RimJ/RimL family protein N-acetyltransferase